MTSNTIRVLLVENREEQAERMLCELRRAGCDLCAERVDTAAGFRAALAGRAWDVVLCDDSIPDFDAQGALDILRESGLDVPLVVVSATIGEERAVALMRAGAADAVMKGSLGRLAPVVERETRQAAGRQERRRAEQENRELAAIVSGADYAIISQTLNGIITTWNAGAERLYGYTAEEALGRNASFLVPPDREDELLAVRETLSRGGSRPAFDTVRLHKSGHRLDVSVSLSPVHDAAGRVVGVSGIGKDITARKRAEADQALLAAVVASSEEPIVIADSDGVILGWNPAAERLFGHSAVEAIGRSNFLLLVPPDLLDESRDRVERARRGERLAPLETVRLRKGGEPVHVAVTVSAVHLGGQVVALAAVYRDITDRKRAEGVLQFQHALLRCQSEASPDGMLVVDPGNRILAYNRRFLDVWGFPHEFAATGDDTILLSLARSRTADPDGFLARVEAIYADPDMQTQDEVALADGRTLERYSGPIRGAGGELLGRVWYFRDITNRKRGAEALRASEARKAAILETALDCIITIDHEGNVVEFNTAAERTFGYRRAQVIGKELDHFIIPPSHRERHRVGMAHYLATGEGSVLGRRLELPALRADGTEFAAELAVTRILTDGPPLFTAYLRDITDRKRAEEALYASEERYRTVVADQTEVVCRVRADGTFLFVNDALCRLVGKPADELLGRPGRSVAHPEDAPRVEAALATLSPDNPVVRIEHRVLDADGQTRWMEFVNRGVFGPGGELVEFQAVGRDVTARREADEMIRESEARYRSLADAMPQIVWATNPDGYHEFYNRQWYDYTGLTFEQSKGEGWAAAFHPDDQPLAWERWRHSLATGGPFEIEYRCRRRDGEYRWFLGRTLPQRAEHGRIVRWFGTCTDIHDFKEAQAERYAALARLDLQIERMPLAYMTTDADFRCTRWNPAAERTFGFTEAEVLGRHPLEILVPPSAHSRVAGFLDRLRAGDMDAHGTNENVTKDGRTIVCEWHNTPLFGPDGAFEGHIALAQDVTDRKVAEGATARLAAIVESSDDAIIGTALSGEVTSWNAGAERLYGYAAAELTGRRYSVLIPPGKEAEAEAVLSRARRGEAVPAFETVRLHQSGRGIDVTVSVSPIRDRSGRVVGVSKIARDVTRTKLLEEQFRQAQKMEAVGQLAGGVAHDFNNLLTVINGYGELVHAALAPGHPSRELVAEITGAGQRAAGLTRQLLAFSRQSVLEPKVLDPNAMVRDVEKLLRRLIGEDIDLAAKLAPDLGRVKADPGQLEQAVVNLCVNARDAMPTGGKLTVETRNVELDAAYAATHPNVRPGPYVVLTISDTGMGMSPEVRARIFEPFFTTKEQGKGTGLGLAMVFGFVKQSGGHIGVHSEVGRGTAFKLYLPRVGDAPLTGKSAIRRVPMPKGTETVLLVEDEDAVRALGRHVLAMCGYTVLEAGNGREAVRVADGHAGTLHILVTDVVMPGGMGGRQVAEAVVARHPEAKVLFTSGYTDDAVVRHGVLEEGTHFLQKPFTPAAFAGKVRDVLDGNG